MSVLYVSIAFEEIYLLIVNLGARERRNRFREHQQPLPARKNRTRNAVPVLVTEAANVPNVPRKLRNMLVPF